MSVDNKSSVAFGGRKGEAQFQLPWMNSMSRVLLTACCPLQHPSNASPPFEYLLYGWEPQGQVP